MREQKMSAGGFHRLRQRCCVTEFQLLGINLKFPVNLEKKIISLQTFF